MRKKTNIRKFIVRNKDKLVNLFGVLSAISFALALCEGLVSCVDGHNNYQAPYFFTIASMGFLLIAYFIENRF